MKEDVRCELWDNKRSQSGMTKVQRGRSTDIKNCRSNKRMKKTHQNTDVGHNGAHRGGEIVVIKDL